MVAFRYGISLLVFNSTSHSSGALTRELSSKTLEEKFHIYTRPCIILYLFESFGVSEVQHLYGKYFVFHMNLAVQEARTILDESIISIEKTSSSNTL